MCHFAPIEPSAATGKAAELLARVEKSTGKVPMMTKVMANSPALLQAYLDLGAIMKGGVLSTPIRERLSIANAQLNGCEYCLSAHTYLGAHVAKLDQDELDRARRAESADPHVDALLKLSVSIAENQGAVSEAELAAAKAAGVTEAEIGELVGNFALAVLSNYFNVLAQTENDWPVVKL